MNDDDDDRPNGNDYTARSFKKGTSAFCRLVLVTNLWWHR